MLFSNISDAKNRSITTTRSLTAIANRILVSFLEMISPVNCIIVSTFEADILKKLTYCCRRCIHFLPNIFFSIFSVFSIHGTLHKVQHSPAVPCCPKNIYNKLSSLENALCEFLN